MSTKAIQEAIKVARAAASCPESPLAKLAADAEPEVAETNKVKALLREMFKERALDPHPTSDGSPEYVLREWCGYEAEDES